VSISAISQGQATSDDALKKITKYIPSEAIALYVASAQFLDPLKPKLDDSGKELPLHLLNFTARWRLAGVFVIVIVPLLVWLIFSYRRWKATKADPPKSGPGAVVQLKTTLVAMIGLAAWIAALGDTPAFDWQWFKQGMGGVAVLVVSFVLAYSAEPLGIDEFES